MAITTIISAWKTQDYIMEALESVRQSDEILLGIDDCKATLEVVKRLRWPNLHLFYFAKCTTYKIRNTLAKVAKNDMLLFFDSDDVMTRFDLLQAASGEIVRFKFKNFRTDGYTPRQTDCYSRGCFMIRKGLFLYYNGFQGWPCCADSEFSARVDSRHKVERISEQVFLRRLHATALTRNGEYGMQSQARRQIRSQIYKRVNSPILDTLATSRCKRLI